MNNEENGGKSAEEGTDSVNKPDASEVKLWNKRKKRRTGTGYVYGDASAINRKTGEGFVAQEESPGDTSQEFAPEMDTAQDDQSILKKDNVSRQVHKDFFRRNVLRGGKDPEGMDPELKKALRMKQLRSLAIVAVIVLVVCLVAVVFQSLHRYSSWRVVWQYTDVEGTPTFYSAFQGKIIKISLDGVSCIDNGEVLWSAAHNMAAPEISFCENYFVVYDKGGKTFSIFNKQGQVSNVNTSRPLYRAEIARQGMVVTVQVDSSGNYIDYYDVDGNSLDIGIKTLISDNGYPLDISISPNGTELVSSYVYMDKGSMINQVVFYNFKEGKSISDRVVGGFKDYENTLVTDVKFFDDRKAMALTDGGIDFYSLSNTLKPSKTDTVTFDRNIKSVVYNQEYICVLLDKMEDDDYQLEVYNDSGRRLFRREIGFECEHLNMSDSRVILYNNQMCQMYDITSGRLKFEGSLSGESCSLVGLTGMRYILAKNGVLQEIELK